VPDENAQEEGAVVNEGMTTEVHLGSPKSDAALGEELQAISDSMQPPKPTSEIGPWIAEQLGVLEFVIASIRRNVESLEKAVAHLRRF